MPSLVEIGLVVLKKKLFKVGHCIFSISLLTPLRKECGPSFEETWIPFTKFALCQVWLKLALWFLRRRFFNFVNVFSLFRNYLPLGKGMVLHLNKLESSPLKDALCQVWLKSAQQFWRRWKCEKFTDRQTARQTDRQMTDKKWSEKLTWAFSTSELKKKWNSTKLQNCRAISNNLHFTFRFIHFSLILVY